MSLLTKLTVGAMAVLGAYALKGKRSDAKTSDHAKPASRRAGARKAPAVKPSPRAARTVERAAKPSATKPSTRKRPARRASAKRAQSA
jgi:hypothetical protein